MVRTKFLLTRLYHLHKQLFGNVSPALIPVRRREVGHAGQRVWMVGPEFRLASLHHLHVQLFGCVPPALIQVLRRWVGQAGQRGRMVRSLTEARISNTAKDDQQLSYAFLRKYRTCSVPRPMPASGNGPWPNVTCANIFFCFCVSTICCSRVSALAKLRTF
jgi:hypothetical protein